MLPVRDRAASGLSPANAARSRPDRIPHPALQVAVVSSDRKGLSMLRASWIGGLLAAVIGLVGSLGHARVSDDVVATKTYAVLVGVSQYADPQIKPRRHAEADAKALYDVLVDKTYLGADKANVHLLLGTPDDKRGGQAATKANILKA